MSRNFEEEPYCEEYDDGTALLCEHFCVDRSKADWIERLKRAVYKNTDCGAWVEVTDNHLVMGSIVEGCDFGTTAYKVPWSKLTDEVLIELIGSIETEAKLLWDASNTDEQDFHGIDFDVTDVLAEFVDGRSS